MLFSRHPRDALANVEGLPEPMKFSNRDFTAVSSLGRFLKVPKLLFAFERVLKISFPWRIGTIISLLVSSVCK